MRARIIYLIKTSRPIGWIIAPLVFLLGFTAFQAELTFVSILQLVLLSIPYCLFLYGINDTYDYESDKINPRKEVDDKILLEKEYYPLVRKLSLIIVVVLLFSALITANLLNIFGMTLLLLFSYQYSAPPLRLKEKPPFDSFSNGIIYYYAPIIIGSSYGATIFDIPFTVYYITMCVMGIHSFSTVMDYSADKMVGDKTFAVVFGKRGAAFFTTIIFTIAFFFSGFQGTFVGYYLIFCTILSLIIVFYPSEKWALRFFYTIGIAFVMVGILEVQKYIILSS